MKKEYFPILICLLGLLIGMNGCNKEEAIPYVAPEKDPVPTNATDSMILDIKNKYQSKIIYKWDRRYVSSSAKASPALFEKVLPYIGFIQEYWFVRDFLKTTHLLKSFWWEVSSAMVTVRVTTTVSMLPD